MADLPWRAIHTVFTILVTLLALWSTYQRARKEEVTALRDKLIEERDARITAVAAEKEARLAAVAALEKEFDKRIEQIEQRLAIQERGYSKLNERLQHMPAAKEVAELSALLRGTGAKLDAVDQRLTTIDTRMGRVEDYLHAARVP